MYAQERDKSRSASRDRKQRARSAAYLNRRVVTPPALLFNASSGKRVFIFDYFFRYAPRDERYFQSRDELRRDRIESRRETSEDREEKANAGRSCSLRRSMRSLFRAISDKDKSKSADLWVDGRPASPGPPVVDLRTPKRSKSLPRSLRKTVSKLVKSRSASTEGRLDEAGASSEQLPAADCVTHVAKRKPRSLFRSMTKRLSKSQGQINKSKSATTSASPSMTSLRASQPHIVTASCSQPHIVTASCSRPQSLELTHQQRLQVATVMSPLSPLSLDSGAGSSCGSVARDHVVCASGVRCAVTENTMMCLL